MTVWLGVGLLSPDPCQSSGRAGSYVAINLYDVIQWVKATTAGIIFIPPSLDIKEYGDKKASLAPRDAGRPPFDSVLMLVASVLVLC